MIDGVDVVDVLLQKLCPKSLLYHSLTRTQVPTRPPPPRGYICQPRRQWTIKVRTQREKKPISLYRGSCTCCRPAEEERRVNLMLPPQNTSSVNNFPCFLSSLLMADNGSISQMISIASLSPASSTVFALHSSLSLFAPYFPLSRHPWSTI